MRCGKGEEAGRGSRIASEQTAGLRRAPPLAAQAALSGGAGLVWSRRQLRAGGGDCRAAWWRPRCAERRTGRASARHKPHKRQRFPGLVLTLPTPRPFFCVGTARAPSKHGSKCPRTTPNCCLHRLPTRNIVDVPSTWDLLLLPIPVGDSSYRWTPRKSSPGQIRNPRRRTQGAP